MKAVNAKAVKGNSIPSVKTWGIIVLAGIAILVITLFLLLALILVAMVGGIPPGPALEGPVEYLNHHYGLVPILIMLFLYVVIAVSWVLTMAYSFILFRRVYR
jgi:hypothetical protein